MEYKDLIIYLVMMAQGLVIYIFTTHKADTKAEIKDLNNKIERIETGDFVEKIVKNVIYSPESRSYFKAIFNEALNHKGKNNDAVNLAILNHLELIEKKLNERDENKDR
jgi:hypothetical protein